MRKIDIYSKGIVACSVCVPKDMKPEEIELAVNLENPTGIESRWTISKDKFRDGGENPHECENDKNRKHYLLNC